LQPYYLKKYVKNGAPTITNAIATYVVTGNTVKLISIAGVTHIIKTGGAPNKKVYFITVNELYFFIEV
jgi:hypothetical protein